MHKLHCLTFVNHINFNIRMYSILYRNTIQTNTKFIGKKSTQSHKSRKEIFNQHENYQDRGNFGRKRV